MMMPWRHKLPARPSYWPIIGRRLPTSLPAGECIAASWSVGRMAHPRRRITTRSP